MGNVAESDDEKLKNQNNTGINDGEGTAPPTSSNEPVSVGSGGGAPAPNFSAPAGGGGGNWSGGVSSSAPYMPQNPVNISDILAANPTSNYNFLDSKVSTDTTNISNMLKSAYDSFVNNNKVAPTFNKTVADNALSTGNTNDISTLKGWLASSYNGPTGLDTAQVQTPLQDLTSSVSNWNTQPGLYNYLLSMPGENPGSAKIDSQSILSSPTYTNDYNKWKTSVDGLNNSKTNYETQANDLYNTLVNSYNSLRNDTSNYLNNENQEQLNTFNNGIKNRDLQEQTVFNDYMNKLKQNGAHGVDKSSYYSYVPGVKATYENILSPNEVVVYNNLQKILGGSQINPSNNWHNGNIVFNSSGYNSAVSQAIANEQAQAQSFANQKASLDQMETVINNMKKPNTSFGGIVPYNPSIASTQAIMNNNWNSLQQALNTPTSFTPSYTPSFGGYTW